MKLFHLIPVLGFTLYFSGRPAEPLPEAVVSAGTGTLKEAVFSEDEKMIPWTPGRRLVWDDFKSEPKKEGEAVASTSTSLGLSYQVQDNQLTYHITCDFSKENSWGTLQTGYILAHEQGHFDITEIHARRLYQALYHYELDPHNFKRDIAAIYNNIVQDKEAMQATYDRETDHSRKRTLQVQWLKKIDTLLNDTQLFAVYP